MKTIIRIARAELRTLFYSPIAWFIITVFLIQCGLVYLGELENAVRKQELGNIGMDTSYLTEIIFVGPGGLFASIMKNLYLYIPLLTMSLISRETSSGTIKLLYTSPIKLRQIVFGKFAGMMVFNLILVAIIGIFVVTGVFHIQHPDTGILMTALLGFYLLVCAYSAIGLFMSSLTSYQVVAAISTFVMIGILSFIGSLWQRVPVVRDLTYFLSIKGRAENLLSGLVTTKDIIYFLVIISIFLSLAILKLKGSMETKPFLFRATRYLIVIGSALLIGYISAVPSLIGYYDATFNKNNTITPQLQQIVKDLGNEPLEVTAYVNIVDNFAYLGNPDSYNKMQARWEGYSRFKNNITLKTVYYWDNPLNYPNIFRDYPGKSLREIAEQNARSYDLKLNDLLDPEQIRKKIDLKSEKNRYVMQLKWKGRTTWLRVFDDMLVWPGETEIGAALKRLQKAKFPKIVFVTSELEREINLMGDRNYKGLANLTTFRNSMVNQGFEPQALSLDTGEIPADIAALVIADPKIAMSKKVLTKLQHYTDKGGNLLIAGEPGRQALLNPFLKQIGVQITEGTIIQESKEQAPDFAMPLVTKFAGSLTRNIRQMVLDSMKIGMPGCAALSYTSIGNNTVHPLLVTDAKLTWNRIQPLDMNMVTKASVAPVLANLTKGIDTTGMADNKNKDQVFFSPAIGDTKGPFTTAVSVTRKVNGREQRMVISGDADFMSNGEMQRRSPFTGNFGFSTALFSWLSYGEFPIDASRPEPKDKYVNVKMSAVSGLKTIFLWVLPAIMIAFSTVLLFRRKRK